VVGCEVSAGNFEGISLTSVISVAGGFEVWVISSAGGFEVSVISVGISVIVAGSFEEVPVISVGGFEVSVISSVGGFEVSVIPEGGCEIALLTEVLNDDSDETSPSSNHQASLYLQPQAN
jgi:hypothetical protein